MEDLFLDGVVPRALDDEISDQIHNLLDRTSGQPSPSTGAPLPHSILHDSSFRPEDTAQPTTSARTGTGEHVIEMSIAPGQTRTATVNLPGLTLEIQVTMPH